MAWTATPFSLGRGAAHVASGEPPPDLDLGLW